MDERNDVTVSAADVSDAIASRCDAERLDAGEQFVDVLLEDVDFGGLPEYFEEIVVGQEVEARKRVSFQLHRDKMESDKRSVYGFEYFTYGDK